MKAKHWNVWNQRQFQSISQTLQKKKNITMYGIGDNSNRYHKQMQEEETSQRHRFPHRDLSRERRKSRRRHRGTIRSIDDSFGMRRIRRPKSSDDHHEQINDWKPTTITNVAAKKKRVDKQNALVGEIGS
jgi:hypothetical protein